MVYYWNEYFCINAGYYYDDIVLLLQTGVSFYDCYKNFILAYCDYSNWVGDGAKIIDGCNDSDEETLTVIEITYDSATKYFSSISDWDGNPW